jgi:2-isopropylmalate synthase
MARRIEIFDTTLRDGNKLPFVVLSTGDRVILARQLARLGVDVIEAGFPSASTDEAECVRRVAEEISGPSVAALSRVLERDVDQALECLRASRKPYLHLFMSGSAHFLRHVLKADEPGAIRAVERCIRAGRSAGVRVQFSLSEAPHASREFVQEVCAAASNAGASVVNLADTNGILLPEDVRALVQAALAAAGQAGAQAHPAVAGQSAETVIGIHCHNDLGLATANTLAGLAAGAGHAEVTVGGFGERAGNAALEELAMCVTAFGERYGIFHGLRLEEIGPTARLFASLTGVRPHPNKPVTGQCAFLPSPGGFSGESLEPKLRALLQAGTIGSAVESPAMEPSREANGGPYTLESFNVLSSSHTPPVGVVVIRRDGKALTQTSHGNGPIDALFHAVDKALGFSTRLLLYSVSTLSTGTGALAEVIVTVELRGRRFHGRHTSTDVIESSIRAYMGACNTIGLSGILDGPSDFHVAGEYLWE